jgi:hypothetical protein
MSLTLLQIGDCLLERFDPPDHLGMESVRV